MGRALGTYPITDPTLAYAMEMRFERLIPITVSKNWLLNLSLKRAKRMSFASKEKQIGFYPSGPAEVASWISYNDSLPNWKDSEPVIGKMSQCYIAIPMGWNILEEAEAKGDPTVIIDKMELRATEGSWALRRALSTALWSGTGGKQPDGISTVIQKAAPGSQTGTHLGVSRSTSWHKNQYVILSDDFGTIPVGSSIPSGILALQDLIEATTVGSNLPFCGIAPKNVIKNIRRAAMESGNYMLSMTKREDVQLGVLTVEVDGVPFGWDPECPADSVYSLHIGAEKKDAKAINNVDSSIDNSDMGELDEVEGASKFFDMDGAFFHFGHPGVNGLKVEPRSGLNSLGVQSWKLFSHNWGFGRLNDHGVAGSDNGSRWSTW